MLMLDLFRKGPVGMNRAYVLNKLRVTHRLHYVPLDAVGIAMARNQRGLSG